MQLKSVEFSGIFANFRAKSRDGLSSPGGTGDAQEPGVGGESIPFISIRQRTCGEHDRSVCANQKQRGCYFPSALKSDEQGRAARSKPDRLVEA